MLLGNIRIYRDQDIEKLVLQYTFNAFAPFEWNYSCWSGMDIVDVESGFALRNFIYAPYTKELK